MTEWVPIKQPPARYGTTVADALDSLSLTGNLGPRAETKESSESSENRSLHPQTPGLGHSLVGQAWDGEDATVPGMDGLWRPSPKVISGANGEGQAAILCEHGVLAAQGSLQPVGQVVFILENNHRVSG